MGRIASKHPPTHSKYIFEKYFVSFDIHTGVLIMKKNIKQNFDLNILLITLLLMFFIKGNEFMNIQYPKLAFVAIFFFLIPRIIYGSANKIKFIDEKKLLIFRNIMIATGTIILFIISIL